MWLLGLLFGAGPQAASVSPSDANLQYVGRWDAPNPLQPWAYAQGSSVVASFTGTSIAATLGVSGGEYFRVILDDDADASVKVQFSSGVPLLLTSSLVPRAGWTRKARRTRKSMTWPGQEIANP